MKQKAQRGVSEERERGKEGKDLETETIEEGKGKHSHSHLFITPPSKNPKPIQTYRPILNQTHKRPILKNTHKPTYKTHKLGLLCKPCLASPWIFDCGATNTMTFAPVIFYPLIQKPEPIFKLLMGSV